MVPASASPKTPPKVPVLVGGAVALVVGIVFLVWGLAPVKGFGPAMDVFGGGTPPEDLGDQIDAAMSELGSRVWTDAVGFILILGGIIAISMGRPQDKSVEQQVQEAVERRLGPTAQVGSEPAGAAPAAPPLRPPPPTANASVPAQAASSPAATAPQRPASFGARCPTCGSLMVAGGRLCPSCG